MLIYAPRDDLSTRMEKAQREDADVKKIIDLAEARKINGYIMRGGVLFKEIDGDLRIVVPISLRSQVVRQAHERGHFFVAKTEALLSQDYWMPIGTEYRRLLETVFLAY